MTGRLWWNSTHSYVGARTPAPSLSFTYGLSLWRLPVVPGLQFADTGACLFSWSADKQQLHAGPFTCRVRTQPLTDPYAHLPSVWADYMRNVRGLPAPTPPPSASASAAAASTQHKEESSAAVPHPWVVAVVAIIVWWALTQLRKRWFI